MKKYLVLLAMALFLVSTSAFAGTFTWSYTPGGTTDTGGSGWLTTVTTATADVELVTAIGGTWDGLAITGVLTPGDYPGSTPGTCCSSPANNNLLYLSGSSYLDLAGLGFSIAPGDPNGDWVNIYDPGTYLVLTGSSSNEVGILTDTGGTFALTPEPMTLGLLGLGLFSLLGLRKKV